MILEANTNLALDGTGKITLNAVQDYESTTKSISATILVADTGSSVRTTTVTTLFFILDVDDNPPAFTPASYTTSKSMLTFFLNNFLDNTIYTHISYEQYNYVHKHIGRLYILI